MLKITLHDGPEEIAFRLEGKLVGAYAHELEQCWLTAASVRGEKALTVDLTSVDFIDEEGRHALTVLHGAGAQFSTSGPLTSAIVEAITGKPQKGTAAHSPKGHGAFVNLTRLALMALGLAATLPLFGQATGQTRSGAAPSGPIRLTLRDAIQTALEQNPQIAIANLSIAEAQQNTIVARAGLLPQANLEVSEAVRRANIQAQIGIPFPNFPKHVGPFEVFTGGPTFSIPVLDLTSYRRWHASREGVAAARANEVSAREQNVQLVVSQYLGGLRAAADVAAAQSRMDVAKALLDLARDLQRNGAGTRIDSIRADVEYQNERQRLLVAETQLKTTVFGLARLLNIDPRTQIELSDKGSFFETPTYEGPSTVDEAFANRPELQALEARLRSLELQRRAAEAERWPKLSITGNWAEQGLTPGSAIPVYNYQGNLDIPLFTAGRIRAQESIASLEVRRAEQERQDLRNRVSLEVQTALADLDSARSQVEVARLGLDLAREGLTQARDRFQAGVANNIEVIQAQDQVARANDNQIQALYQYNQARADLARATGQIERLYTR